MLTPQQLQQEIQSDPTGLGYAPLVAQKQYGQIAEVLNSATSGVVSSVASVDTKALQSAVVASEYLSLSAQQRDLWAALLSAAQGSVPIRNTNIRQQALAVFTTSSPNTRTNLAALQTKAFSRAEVLGGERTVVGFYDVYYAIGQAP